MKQKANNSWPDKKNTIPVRVLGAPGEETAGKLFVENRSFVTRLTQGLKFLLLFGALASISIFIPGLHFILVPAFSIVGLFGFFVTLTKTEMVTGIEASCPRCGTALFLAAQSPRFPLYSDCSNCAKRVGIERLEGGVH